MVTLSSVSPDVPIAPVSVARSSLAFSFNRNVLVLVLVVLCLGSCGISTLHPPEPSSLSAEIAALRASTVRFRASHFGPTNSIGSNHEVGNGDTEATTVNPESLDGTVLPGKRTVEEHDRWPAVLNSDSSANLSSDTSFPENALISLNAVDLPLNVLLHSLADEVDLQLSIQGSHTQSVTLRVVETSLAEILEILFQQASFRWQIIGRQLRILPDLPFLKTYPISYLNLTRRMQGSVGLATQVGSINLNQESGSSSGFSNSSQSLIENEAHHAFWESWLMD